MGIVLTVLEPPHHPDKDLIASLPAGIGRVIDVCPRLVSPRYDTLLVTARGLVVRDPASREYFGMPWSNFSLDAHLRQHSRHAVLTLWLHNNRPVELAIERRLASNIAAVAPVLKMHPDATIDDVVVAKLPAEPLYAHSGHPQPPSLGFFSDVDHSPKPAAAILEPEPAWDEPIIVDDEPVVEVPPSNSTAEFERPAELSAAFDPMEQPTAPLPPVTEDLQPQFNTAKPVERDRPTTTKYRPLAERQTDNVDPARSLPTGPDQIEAVRQTETALSDKPGDSETGNAPLDESPSSRPGLVADGAVARRAAWACAALLLLFAAGVVGSFTSQHTNSTETDTRRLLTSQSVDLD